MKRNLQRLGLVLVASLAMLSCSKEGMGYEDNPNGGDGVTPSGLNCNGSMRTIGIVRLRNGVQDTIYDQTTYSDNITYNAMGYTIECGERKEFINQAPIGQIDNPTYTKTIRIIDLR